MANDHVDKEKRARLFLVGVGWKAHSCSWTRILFKAAVQLDPSVFLWSVPKKKKLEGEKYPFSVRTEGRRLHGLLPTLWRAPPKHSSRRGNKTAATDRSSFICRIIILQALISIVPLNSDAKLLLFRARSRWERKQDLSISGKYRGGIRGGAVWHLKSAGSRSRKWGARFRAPRV